MDFCMFRMAQITENFVAEVYSDEKLGDFIYTHVILKFPVINKEILFGHSKRDYSSVLFSWRFHSLLNKCSTLRKKYKKWEGGKTPNCATQLAEPVVGSTS